MSDGHVSEENEAVLSHDQERARLLRLVRQREARIARLEDDLSVLARSYEAAMATQHQRSRSRWTGRHRVPPSAATSGHASDSLAPPAIETQADLLQHANDRLESGTAVTRVKAPETTSRVVCSLADGAYLRPLAIAGRTFEEYGRRHWWDVVLRFGSLAPDRPIAWSKIRLVTELLDEYEEVLWIDADAVIVDPGRDIREDADPEKPLSLVEHTWDDPPGRRAVNTGVMLVRRSDWSREFLSAVWAHEKYIGHTWWENTAILEMLGYSIPADGTPPVPGPPTVWSDGVGLLPMAWNSTENASAAVAPIIRHIGRRPTVAALEALMIDEVRRVRAVDLARVRGLEESH